MKAGLFDDAPNAEGRDAAENTPIYWRIGTAPFPLSSAQVAVLQELGHHLLAFYRALNALYGESIRGTQPTWAAGYLDQGKPESLVSYSRMKRFRDATPLVIRPDILLTEEGLTITELDSVPGGIGLTACLSAAYADTGPDDAIVGQRDGMVLGFARMIRAAAGGQPGGAAIVVSEEAKDYRPEMTWLAGELRKRGIEAGCVGPRDVRFTEEGLWLTTEAGEQRIAVLYRFFELFDLKNVPKSELIMYSAKKEQVVVTPPFKPALEEKLAFALLHHPALARFWDRELGEETFGRLKLLMPRTWILDPQPIPPMAVIPGLEIAGRPIADWHQLAEGTQKDRRYVIKPSGFSELAWGSRGVSIGHDLPQREWAETIDAALRSFPTTPYILQAFHKGHQVDLSYYDAHHDAVVPMTGRTRLSPYYFVADGEAQLGGILATVCPPDKKIIHGMKDAIMVPCATMMNAE